MDKPIALAYACVGLEEYHKIKKNNVEISDEEAGMQLNMSGSNWYSQPYGVSVIALRDGIFYCNTRNTQSLVEKTAGQTILSYAGTTSGFGVVFVIRLTN